MKYEEVLDLIFNSLPVYQRQGPAKGKFDLNNTIRIDDHFHNPHRNYKTIHVAGTNGKGSVSHMIASVLQEAGFKTGLYTSPHLLDFRERIRINGKKISRHYVTGFIDNNLEFFKSIKASFFEMTVGMAFQYFKEEKIDIAVIETGMGGRLDSTNIITPLLSVITNISFDHTAFLGDSIEKIAFEKAGIVKEEKPVITGKNQKEAKKLIREVAEKKNSRFIYAPDVVKIKSKKGERFYKLETRNNNYNFRSKLSGWYQKENFQTAIAALEELGEYFSPGKDAIETGLSKVVENTSIRGRWEKLNDSPPVFCDVAHNVAGLESVIKQINDISYDDLYIVLGVVDDKDLDSVLPLFPKNAFYIFTQASIPRAMVAEVLSRKAAEHGLTGKQVDSVKEAYKTALKMASDNDLIFVGGSTFTVAEVLS